jgi:hypothetical protein
MIKKQQKWIALLVTLTFMWLLQVSNMPLAAANTAEQVSSAGNEQGPRFIEEEGNGGYLAKKKSILPIILIGVGVVAVAAVLILVVFKTKYDPLGAWAFKWRDMPTYDWTTEPMNFSGNRTSGTVTYRTETGTFSLDGKKLTFQWTYGTNNTITFTGEFQTKDQVTGTYTSSLHSAINGQFELNRAATTTALKNNPAKIAVGE